MRMRLGRNSLCWCGSSKKYKKCHLGREGQAPLNPWDASKKFRKEFGVRDCLVPDELKSDCSGTIIKVHTVPKSGSLKQIARNGHLYSIKPSPENIQMHKGRILPEILGINEASTFTGFCSVHDNTIFTKLEDQPFIGTQEQCFLLGYRAIARELFTKKAAGALQPLLRQADKGKSLHEQMSIQAFANLVGTGVSTGLNDIELHKSSYDQVLLGQDFRNVRACIISLDSPPPVMCSGGTFLEQDFNGNDLQDVGNLTITLDLITFTSFYGGTNGVVVFTWLPQSDSTCLRFIESLNSLSQSEMGSALTRFFFEFCENLHIRPDWWEGLAQSSRTALVTRLTNSANPMLARRSGILTDDGLRFQEWEVSGTRALGF